MPIIVFQHEAFAAQGFPPNDTAQTEDPAYTTQNSNQSGLYTSGSPSQKTEEDWLDQNATPLLIDRYTGTLIRAE